jgi:hypothetical protein
MVKLHMLSDLERLCIAPVAQQASTAASAQGLRAALQRVQASVADVESHTRMLELLRAVAALKHVPAITAEAWQQQVCTLNKSTN